MNSLIVFVYPLLWIYKDGQRCWGRSSKTWMQCVEEDMKLVKLCGDDAQDRVDWRIGIRGHRLARASKEKQTLKR